MGVPKHVNEEAFTYYSKRYGKSKTVPVGFGSDGATGAIDIDSRSWWVHDILCRDGTWDDGTRCTHFEASVALFEILEQEGRHFRKYTWFTFVWLIYPLIKAYRMWAGKV